MAVKFCVIIVLLLQWHDVRTQGSTTNSDFTFTCNMAGDVVITVSGDYDHYAVQNTAADQDVHLISDGTCADILTSISTGNTITLSGCDRKLPIYLYLMKTGAKIDNVIGGHFKEYKLSCDLTSGGKDETVDKGFAINGVTPVPTPKNEQPTITLKMEFNPATAKIGDPINVKITDTSTDTQYKDTEKHYVVPQTCTATADDGSSGTVTAVIYQVANTRRDFFEATFASGTIKEATAVLHAFKFDVASNNVQVSCNVKVCPTATCKAAVVGRRRRSVTKDEGTLHEVTGTFQIVSKSDNSSSAGDRADAPKLILLLTMLAACILRQIIH